jgi:hypothetical protein
MLATRDQIEIMKHARQKMKGPLGDKLWEVLTEVLASVTEQVSIDDENMEETTDLVVKAIARYLLSK